MKQSNSFPLRLISGFKFKSILVKTLALLLVFLVLVAGGIYLIFGSVITRQYQEEVRAGQQLLLTRVNASVEAAMAQAGGSMNRMFGSQSVTGMMISPTRRDYARLVEVMAQLERLPQEEALIERAYLYVFGSDNVYASDGEITQILDCPDKKMIIACLTSSERRNDLAVGDVTLGLMEYEGRIILFQKYPTYRALGVLVAELSPEAFYAGAVGAGDQSGGPPIAVYDQNGRPLFPGQTTYPDGLPAPTGAPGFRVERGSELIAYTYSSPSSGFTYRTVTDAGDAVPAIPVRRVLAAAAPYLVVVVLLTALLAVYLIWAVYKPIQDVIYSMISTGHGSEGDGNELEFIRSTFQDSADRNLRLSELLSEVKPAVADRVLGALLSDSPMEESAVRSVLASIGSPLPLDGRCLAFVATQDAGEGNSLELEREISRVWFLSFCGDYWRPRFPCHFMQLPGGLCAGILCFGHEVSKAQIKFALAGFQEAVDRQSKNMPCHWSFGFGQLHIGLMEVRASYLEAREALNRQIYFQREGASAGADNDFCTAYFVGRAGQLVRFALDGRTDDLQAGLSLLQEVEDQCQDTACALQACQGILNVLVEELVKYNVELPHHLREDIQLLPGLERKALAAQMQPLCAGLLELLQTAGQKGRNKHVDAAVKYIADNFTSSNLSLDEVSRHVGISSPYLSKIFAETLDCGFLDYLNQYRIDRAKQLLTATDLQVAEVGYRVGFHSSQNFTRVFKKFMGDTPSRYRELVKRPKREEEA